MISDPSFAEAHRSPSAAALLFSVPDLGSRRQRKYTLVSVKNGEARLPLVPVSSPPGIEFPCRNIPHSVNGLVCIYEQYEKSYREPPPRVIVFNPSTREYVTLPPTIFAHPVFCLQCNSLGFDPSTKTYKILREWIIGPRHRKYEIFTVGGGGAWRIIEDGPVYRLTTKGICLNGIIYWTYTRIVEGGVRQNTMIAFDVGEENFRDVPVPPASRTWNSDIWNIIEIGGHIAIVDFYDDVDLVESNCINLMTMWTLEDSINGIWSKKRIALPEFCISSNQLPYIMRRPFVTSINNGEITLIPFFTSIDNGEVMLISSWLFVDWYVFHYNLEEERGRIEFITRSPENDWNGSFTCIERCDITVYKESLTSFREICRL